MEYDKETLEDLISRNVCDICQRKAIAISIEKHQPKNLINYFCENHIYVAYHYLESAVNYKTPFLLYVKYLNFDNWHKI